MTEEASLPLCFNKLSH